MKKFSILAALLLACTIAFSQTKPTVKKKETPAVSDTTKKADPTVLTITLNQNEANMLFSMLENGKFDGVTLAETALVLQTVQRWKIQVYTQMQANQPDNRVGK